MPKPLTLPRRANVGVALTLVGVALLFLTHWLVFVWVPSDIRQGFIQHIFYVHVPSAWITEAAFIFTALYSGIYLWLGDERADVAASTAAEGGLFFAVILLISGPLWGRVAWGTYWTWEPRLTLTLLLFFIFIGYFLVRSSTENPEKGKRFAAVVAIVGAVDIPFIHMSVYWFRSIHPEPVVMRPDGPMAPAEMLITLAVALTSYTLVFAGISYVRYIVELLDRQRLREEVLAA
jgi:heme exporter protein C